MDESVGYPLPPHQIGGRRVADAGPQVAPVGMVRGLDANRKKAW